MNNYRNNWLEDECDSKWTSENFSSTNMWNESIEKKSHQNDCELNDLISYHEISKWDCSRDDNCELCNMSKSQDNKEKCEWEFSSADISNQTFNKGHEGEKSPTVNDCEESGYTDDYDTDDNYSYSDIDYSKTSDFYLSQQAKMLSVSNTPHLCDKNWLRTLKKYSISNYNKLSPIKHCEAILKPILSEFYENDLINAWTWIVNMSEQFYYDNSLIIVKSHSNNDKNLKNILKSSMHAPTSCYFQENWKDFVVLGRGAFGICFRVYDRKLDKFFVSKLIYNNESDDAITSNRMVLLDFIRERNYLLKSRNCPFVVQFYYSMRLPKTSQLMLVFEYCLTDMKNVFHDLGPNVGITRKSASNALLNKIDNFIMDGLDMFQDITGIDLYFIILIYSFELLCCLDFLAKSNIIHRDIKPGNVMITTNLHLKLGDFGLVYNTIMITRKTQTIFVEHNNVDKIESSNYKPQICGTIEYYDPEILLKISSTDFRNHKIISDYLNQWKDVKLEFNPLHDFMSDLYAVGLIISEMLFLGDNPFIYIPKSVYNHFSFDNRDVDYVNTAKLLLFQETFDNYVKDGLNASKNAQLNELINLLLTILDARENRAKEYSAEKIITLNPNKHKIRRHVDILKIEEIPIFKLRHIDSHNVFLLNISEKFKSLFYKESKIEHSTFENFLNKYGSTENLNILEMNPGIYFNTQ